MPNRNMPKGSILFKGYMSPAPGNLPKKEAMLLAEVYSGCRHRNPGEIKSRKTKCAKEAWSVVNKVRE